MSSVQTVDAVVVGAGPAGCTVACRLAQMGHRVVLVERQKFPREHIGESFPGKVLQLLQVIGADQRIASAGFLRTHAALIHWTSASGTLRREVDGPPYLQVERAVFDQILLDHARACGVQILQPATATVHFCEAQKWITKIENTDTELRSSVLLDASGAHGLRAKRLRQSPPTVAIFGYFESDPTKEAVSRVEAQAESWMWCTPLACGKTAVAAFFDNQWVRQRKGQSFESLLRQQCSDSNLFRHLRDRNIQGTVRVCDASVTVAAQPIHNGLIRVGDASLSMDPLSSQGGLMAIASALQAATLANTLLQHPERQEMSEAFARATQRNRLRQHLQTSAAYYREKLGECDSQFWQIRAAIEDTAPTQPPLLSPQCRLTLAQSCCVQPTSIIAGDVVASAPSLHHPALEPIAFVSGRPIVDLLNSFYDQPSVAQLLERWTNLVGDNSAVELFSRLRLAGAIIAHKVK